MVPRPSPPIPVPLLILVGVALLVWIPFRRSVTGRTVYAIGSAEGAAYMSGLPIARAKIAAFTLAGFFAACGGLYLAIQTSSGNADVTQAGAYTLNSIAAVVLGGTSLLGGIGGAIGSLVGAMILRVISFYFRILAIDPLLQPLIEGAGAARRGQPRRGPHAPRQEPPRALPMTDARPPPPREPADRHRRRLHPRHPRPRHRLHPVRRRAPRRCSRPNYLLQQLQIGAFLGIVAAGMMMVILLGHIDLSVPWTLTAAAMMATTVGGPWAIPTGLAVGLARRPLQRLRRRRSCASRR